jgi:hypothetical protein
MPNVKMRLDVEFESLINEKNKQDNKNNVPGLHFRKILTKDRETGSKKR